MTDVHGDGALGADDESEHDDGSLDSLKAADRSAEETDVLDGIGGSPRLTWNSVTDAGGAPSDLDGAARADETAEKSSFQFDLGGALARLGGEEVAPSAAPVHSEDQSDELPATPFPSSEHAAPQAPVVEPEPLPSRGAQAPVAEPEPLPSRGAQAPVVEPEPLPSRGVPVPVVEPAAESAPSEYPRRVPGTHFESQMRDAPDGLPDITEATPADTAPRTTVKKSVFDDATPGVPGAPILPGGPNVSPGGAPSLPSSNPAASPLIVEPLHSAPSTSDITALRSAQMRASKQHRAGKLFGRSLLAFVLIGGVIAAALVFGRAMLFDTEWDAELTPIVNDVEAAHGAEFEHTVPLETISATAMGDRLRAVTIGDDWVDQVPEWRALGLATGSVSAESVGAALAASTVAIYDSTDDTIYMIENVDPDVAADDLRVALERAFDEQTAGASGVDSDAVGTSTGFVGVSPLASIAERSVDVAIVSSGEATERQPADETLPFPIAYELAAVEVLGEPILASVGVAASEVSLGGPYPEGVATALDDDPGTAASVLIQLGEVSLASPIALGNDDWSLVWGARLPETTVDRLIEQVDADSYRPVDRGGTVCAVGVFETATEADGASVFAAMLTWTANAPAGSQAAATQLSPTRVQLEACDPGVEGGVAPNIGVVDALIDRQQVRLAN